MGPFEQVVQVHGPTVWRVCRALLPEADADDAWSETFMSAMVAYPDLRADSNVRGWLVTIAHRKAIDQLRRLRRAPQPQDDTGGQPAAMSSSATVPGDGILPDDREGLWAALAQLPEKQRAAVVYHHVAGLPYGDIGPLLSCSAAAARRSASDGMATLRRIYPKEAPR